MFVPTFSKCNLDGLEQSFHPIQVLSLRIKLNRLMMLASTISPLALMAFLNILM
jgi:hypothetical protein